MWCGNENEWIKRKLKRHENFKVVRPSYGVIAYIHCLWDFAWNILQSIFPICLFLPLSPSLFLIIFLCPPPFARSLFFYRRRRRLQFNETKTSHPFLYGFGLPNKAARLPGAVTLNMAGESCCCSEFPAPVRKGERIIEIRNAADQGPMTEG